MANINYTERQPYTVGQPESAHGQYCAKTDNNTDNNTALIMVCMGVLLFKSLFVKSLCYLRCFFF